MPGDSRAEAPVELPMIAMVIHLFVLRFVVFFGCAAIFINLVRGEMLDRTLHYRLLVPMRREFVFASKYLGGLVASLSVFLTLTLGSLFLLHLPYGLDHLRMQLLSGHGFKTILGYVTATCLATMAYGAAFLAAGLFFKSPIVPAGLFLAWESATPFLPPLLKNLTVWYHLMSFNPVSPNDKVFALMADPTPVWLAALGLICGSGILLAIAAWRSRTLEISYSID
jgi:ABC-type Na+ efflux pump permease subunit